MIWTSVNWLFFIRNLIDPAGEKILLMNPVIRGGGGGITAPAVRPPCREGRREKSVQQ
jgi:hypothetical protein